MFEEQAELSDEKLLGRARDVLARIPAGEPVFVLRGQDYFAASLVRLWCDLNALNPKCPPAKLAGARKIALAMDQWPHKKWPD